MRVLKKNKYNNLIKEDLKLHHGTTAKIDSFKTDAVDSGVGQQAYGWGLYFTDLEYIAEHYADLAKNVVYSKVTDVIRRLYRSGSITEKGYYLLQVLCIDIFKNKELTPDTYKSIKDYMELAHKEKLDEIQPTSKDLNDAKEYATKIHNDLKVNKFIYTVRIHKGKSPSEYKFLDWQEPLPPEDIPIISSALEKNKLNPTLYGVLTSKNVKGIDIYLRIVGLFISHEVPEKEAQKKASLFLKDNVGYTGIKYVEMKKNKVANNYVIFDDKAIEIENVFEDVK